MTRLRLPGEWHNFTLAPHPQAVVRPRRRRIHLSIVTLVTFVFAAGSLVSAAHDNHRGFLYGDFVLGLLFLLGGFWLAWYTACIPQVRIDLASGRSVMERRAVARRIALVDRSEAAALRIGRPDLKGTFDDGGLFDVNHLDAQQLTAIPGFPEGLGESVVIRRLEFGGFDSDGDMEIQMSLDPHQLDACRERLVFVRD